MSATVLIISPAGRLRDGLCSILRSFEGVGKIFTADNFEVGYELAARHQPAVIIVEADDELELECALMKPLLSRIAGVRCLVIANTMRRATQARQVGADAVLLRGFSTNDLYRTLISLSIIPEIPLSGKQAIFNRQKVTTVPLEQKS